MSASRRRQPLLIFTGIWLVLMGLALFVDLRVATFMRDSGIAGTIKGTRYAETIKAPGVFWMTCVIALLVGFFHALKWRAAGFILLCGIMSAVNSLLKWMIGRTRPFKGFAPLELQPFRDGFWGLFYQRDLGFPSGHACLAFATAAGLGMIMPRWRWAFFAGATLVAIERVAENAHYLSDSLGAAGVGILGAHLIAWICRRLVGTDEIKPKHAPGFEVRASRNNAPVR